MYENYVKIFEDHYITIELEKNEYILTNNQSKDKEKSKLKVDPNSGFQLELMPKATEHTPEQHAQEQKPKDVQH